MVPFSRKECSLFRFVPLEIVLSHIHPIVMLSQDNCRRRSLAVLRKERRKVFILHNHHNFQSKSIVDEFEALQRETKSLENIDKKIVGTYTKELGRLPTENLMAMSEKL